MKPVRVLVSIAALTGTSLVLSAGAMADDRSEGRHRQQTAAIQVAQAEPARQDMGMRAGATTPGHGDQMKAMQEVHDKMLAATTPEERNALMAEQMELMGKGMHMMGGMGVGAGTKPSHDMSARQDMMEERMDMMQSMMQMMMDRMQPVPATK